LGHFLTGLNIQLESALKLWQTNPDRAQTFLSEAKRLGSKALQEVRQSVAALRSHPLQHQSLEAAIGSLVQESHQATGILPICDLRLSQSTPLDISTAVYRIIQEALTNICKYAQATQVKIQLEETATDLRLTIQDDGVGFKVEQNTTGFGLQGMRERTLALGGQFLMVSELGKGCQIQAIFPLQAAAFRSSSP